VGDAARITLFFRTLPAGGGVLFVAAGALVASEIAHVAVQAVLLGLVSAVYAFPLVPVVALTGGSAALVATVAVLRHRLKHTCASVACSTASTRCCGTRVEQGGCSDGS
jgi:hypothetical protein